MIRPESQVAFTERLEEWLRVLTRPISFIGVLGMLIVAGVTVVDVLLRWIANAGISALNEVVAMVFSVAVAACIPSGLAGRVNLTIDMLAHRIDKRLAGWLGAAGSVLLGVFYGLLAWRIELYAASLGNQGRTTVILGWPQAPFLHAVSVLLAIGTIVQAVVAINAIRRALAPGIPGAAEISPSRTVTSILACAAAAIIVLTAWGIADFPILSRWSVNHTATAVTLAFALMWICLLGLVPLAAVMGLMGIVCSALFLGMDQALSAVTTEITGFLTNSQVATLPLFLMMGSFAAVAGISEDIYRLAQALLGGLRGGLALATIGGCAGFGAVTGSSLATVATFGRVALPEMRTRGYAAALATGCVAAGGTLGALIPPSGPLVVFALLTEASIGQLFIAAIVPGLIATVFYMLTISTYVRLVPDSAPPAERAGAAELVSALKRCGAVVLLFGSVIGGMYSGVFTATEAAAVGAFGAFLVALVRGKLRAGVFWNVMAETTATTAMIYGLIFGALGFSFFVGITALPEKAMAFLGTLNLPGLVVIALIMVAYLVLGSIMDSFAVMIITVPIVTPLILHMGYDLVWWGVVMLVVVETGVITPPFGLNVFVLKSMLPDVPMSAVFRGVGPFIAADLVKLVLIILFPVIVLWLPSTMAR